MNMPEIRITHTVKEDRFGGTFPHYLRKPWLPDGCQECGVYEGSPFEIRLMYLICYHKIDFPTRFLCKDCLTIEKNQEIDSMRDSY